MKKIISRIIVALMIFVAGISIYLLLNPNKAFEQIFKFNEDYKKTREGAVSIYQAPNMLYNSEKVLKELASTRELAQTIFKSDFSSHDSIAIFIMLPGYRGYEKLTSISGAYMTEMETILINGEQEQFASSTTIHEYSHFLFDLYLKEHGMTIEEIPAWFTEGLAEYFAFRIEQALLIPVTYYYHAFPFEKLEVNEQMNVSTIYIQGFYAIYDLIETYGEEVVTQIIASYKQSGDFVTAFEEVTHKQYATYHQDFFLNRNQLQNLTDNEKVPERILVSGEAMLADKSTINPYTPLVLPTLIKASLELNNVKLAKSYLEHLDQMLFNPYDYLYYALHFAEAGEQDFAIQLIEKGRTFAKDYYYDLEEFEKEARKIKDQI